MHEFIYRPQHKSKEELTADFVLRVAEYEKLMSNIRDEPKETLPQHWLIQGKRGMGKTTLMHRTHYQVQDELRSSGVISVMFSEEQYSVRMLYKLWEQTALYLEDNEPDYMGIWYEMQDAQEAEDYAEKCFDILRKKVQELGHRLVLFIDNFGVMVDKFTKNEQQRLREILLTSPELKIIGGSAVMLESFYKYDKPFFDFFKVMSLKSLSSQEVNALLLQLNKRLKDSAIKETVKTQPGRIEAMRILTGGVPRTIVLLFNILLDRDQGNSIDDLKKILDEVTPLYKHRMDELPPHQQEIVDRLALNWDGMSTGELVKVTRMESKALSAQLNQLTNGGTVLKIKSTGKNHFYQIEERFFNIWYLMQHAPRGARQKVIWLTRFLEVWCDEKTLEQSALHFSKRLTKERIHQDYARTMTYAYATVEGISLNTRDMVIEAAKPIMAGESLMKYGDWYDNFVTLIKKENWLGARAWVEKGALPDSEKYFFLALVYYELGDYQDAINYNLRAMDKGNAEAANNLAIIYDLHFDNKEKSEEYYLLAINNGYKDSLFNLAILHEQRFNNYKKAEEYYIRAMKQGESKALNNLAFLYENQFQEYRRAEKFYLKAIEEDDLIALNNLGVLYDRKLDNLEKAELYYLRAIENNDVTAMNNLGILYDRKMKRPEKAQKWYLRAIDQGSINAICNLLALAIAQNLNQYKKNAIDWTSLVLIEQSNPGRALLASQALFWSDAFKEARQLLESILAKPGELEEHWQMVKSVLNFIIAKGLRNYAYKLFQKPELQLKDRFKIHYYALMKLMEDEYPNEIRRMGKELEEPVNQMVEEIKEMEKKYK